MGCSIRSYGTAVQLETKAPALSKNNNRENSRCGISAKSKPNCYFGRTKTNESSEGSTTCRSRGSSPPMQASFLLVRTVPEAAFPPSRVPMIGVPVPAKVYGRKKHLGQFPVTKREINKPATVQKPEKAIISRGSIPITTGLLTNWRQVHSSPLCPVP